MKLSKNKRIILILAIIFIIFNVIIFAIPSSFTSAFWMAYVFTIIGFVLLAYSWGIFVIKNEKPNSKFLRIPVIYVVSVYMIIQIVILLFFKLVSTPTWVSFVVNTLALGICLIFTIAVDGNIDYVRNLGQKTKAKVNYIKMLEADVELIIEDNKNNGFESSLKELLDKIKYSDPMSDSALNSIENKISANIDLMKIPNNADMECLISETISLISERNKKCKVLK